MLIRTPIFLCALALLVACTESKSNGPPAGPDQRGTSSGPINGFGSIFVAGTEWDTESAESITIDGEEVSEHDLQLGMRVTVEGIKPEDDGRGIATRVAVDNRAHGPISASPPPEALSSVAAGPEEVRFTVLGEFFIAGSGTAFSCRRAPRQCPQGGGLSNLLQVGAWVEVSGVPGIGGGTRATRVALETRPADDPPVEVEGRVSGLDPVSGDFLLASGALLVRKRGAEDERCMGSTDDVVGGVQDGMLVEVWGVYLTDLEICADRIQRDGGLADVGDFEIVGVVTAVDEEADRFTLGDLSVQTDRSTEFEPRRLDLVVGHMLEVTGSLEGGTLSAVMVAQESSVLVEGEVESLVNGGPDIMVLGQIIEVFSEGGTMIRDGPYGVGSSVEVAALRKATGGLSAVEVRVEDDAASRVRIKGRVDAVNVFADGVGSFRIEGVLVSVDSSSECEDANGMIIECKKFFEALEVGDLVDARSGRKNLRFEGAAATVAFGD